MAPSATTLCQRLTLLCLRTGTPTAQHLAAVSAAAPALPPRASRPNPPSGTAAANHAAIAPDSGLACIIHLKSNVAMHSTSVATVSPCVHGLQSVVSQAPTKPSHRPTAVCHPATRYCTKVQARPEELQT